MTAEKEYVLGTHDAEVERLGLQHRVWLPHASHTWRQAGFSAGQTLIDLGCGPGYAALDLAAIVGRSGRVVAIDRSRRFLDALGAAARARGLAQLEAVELDLDEQPLPALAADGLWARWLFAFVKGPEPLLRRAAALLRPGGVVALHEYLDYRAFRVSPRSAVFEEFVAEVMASWRAGGGEPDIALELPRWLEALGFQLLSVRPISEVARPGGFLWEWPAAFVAVGLDRLVALGRVAPARAEEMRRSFDEAGRAPGGFLVTPTVLEIVARKR
jgi:SAM-dependent methyltransferase